MFRLGCSGIFRPYISIFPFRSQSRYRKQFVQQLESMRSNSSTVLKVPTRYMFTVYWFINPIQYFNISTTNSRVVLIFEYTNFAQDWGCNPISHHKILVGHSIFKKWA
jgi:hypothetical protein